MNTLHETQQASLDEQTSESHEPQRPAYGRRCATRVYLLDHPEHPAGLPSWLTPQTERYDASVARVGEADVEQRRTAFLRGWDDPRGNHWCGYCYAQYQLMTLGEQLGYPDTHALYAEMRTRDTRGYDAWLQLARTAGGVLIASLVRAASARLAAFPSAAPTSFRPHTIYTLGYRSPGALEQVQARVDAGALLLDIRQVPQSRYYPAWRRDALAARFGAAYRHLPALGNIHYRTPALPMQLQDAASGLRVLADVLQARDVLLLCGCPDPATCHRSLVCQLLHAQRPQVSIMHLVYTSSAEPCWEERPMQHERRAS